MTEKATYDLKAIVYDIVYTLQCILCKAILLMLFFITFLTDLSEVRDRLQTICLNLKVIECHHCQN